MLKYHRIGWRFRTFDHQMCRSSQVYFSFTFLLADLLFNMKPYFWSLSIPMTISFRSFTRSLGLVFTIFNIFTYKVPPKMTTLPTLGRCNISTTGLDYRSPLDQCFLAFVVSTTGSEVLYSKGTFSKLCLVLVDTVARLSITTLEVYRWLACRLPKIACTGVSILGFLLVHLLEIWK